MKELYERYQTLLKEEQARTDEINATIAKKKKSIKLLEKQIEKLESRTYHYPSWVQTVLIPLANKITERIRLSYEIYGPFGLSCETSVYFREDMSKSICDQPTKHITVIPKFSEDNFYLEYYTGEMINEYEQGSIGELNGWNNCRATLPDDFEKIVAIVNKNSKEIK